METRKIEIPEQVIEQYDALCRIIQKSEGGEVDPKTVAREYYHKDYSWFLRAIQSGRVPYAWAFGEGRMTSYIGVLPFYAHETQGLLLRREVVGG